MPIITLENGKKVEISQESYDALVGAVQEKRWKPEQDERYYWVPDGGYVSHTKWKDDVTDKWNYSQRNVFRTKEEAEKHLEYLKALAVLKDDAEDFEPDWSDNKRYKYFVGYDHYEKAFSVENTVLTQYSDIYFETEEQARRSIDIHEKAWLIVLNVKEQKL